ncbi:MAG: hypothetical protein CM15mV8_1880 [Caudoviricetes sp.]|nr:MAG: hypothetical protein CM15mV8_1880 [Caudoviricetes sp.]
MRFNNDVMTLKVGRTLSKRKQRYKKMQGTKCNIELIKQTPDLYDTYPDEWTFSAKWYDREDARFSRSK